MTNQRKATWPMVTTKSKRFEKLEKLGLLLTNCYRSFIVSTS